MKSFPFLNFFTYSFESFLEFRGLAIPGTAYLSLNNYPWSLSINSVISISLLTHRWRRTGKSAALLYQPLSSVVGVRHDVA